MNSSPCGGVSLGRIASPLLGLAAVTAGIVLVVNLLWAPGAKAHADAMIQSLRGKKGALAVENIFFTNLNASRDWYIRRFDTTHERLDNPEIHDTHPDGTPAQTDWLLGISR